MFRYWRLKIIDFKLLLKPIGMHLYTLPHSQTHSSNSLTGANLFNTIFVVQIVVNFVFCDFSIIIRKVNVILFCHQAH